MRSASLRDDLRPPLTLGTDEQGGWLSGRWPVLACPFSAPEAVNGTRHTHQAPLTLETLTASAPSSRANAFPRSRLDELAASTAGTKVLPVEIAPNGASRTKA